jgi:hypothetical protein
LNLFHAWKNYAKERCQGIFLGPFNLCLTVMKYTAPPYGFNIPLWNNVLSVEDHCTKQWFLWRSSFLVLLK